MILPVFPNNGHTTHEVTLGAPEDISNICVYDWYECTYHCDHGYLTDNRDKVGILLGPKNEYILIFQAPLTSKGTVVTCQTISKLRKSELVCQYERRKENLFDDNIEKKLGSSIYYPEKPNPENYIRYE